MHRQNTIAAIMFTIVISTEANTIPQAWGFQGQHGSRSRVLRRSTTLKSDLCDSSSSHEACELIQATSTYNPVHTTHLKLTDSSRRFAFNQMGCTKPTEQPRVFTRLQTQLYPEIRFWAKVKTFIEMHSWKHNYFKCWKRKLAYRLIAQLKHLEQECL